MGKVRCTVTKCILLVWKAEIKIEKKMLRHYYYTHVAIVE